MKFNCPRRRDSLMGMPLDPADDWREDDGCSYCGSLNPDVLMARLEAGDVEMGPTDKSYKLYVHNHGGAPFKQTYRECGGLQSGCPGYDECTHWVTREVAETKFYFQHLSVEQMKRFVELHNDRTMKIGYPGYFYVWPFFMGPA